MRYQTWAVLALMALTAGCAERADPAATRAGPSLFDVTAACDMASLDWRDDDERQRLQAWARAASGDHSRLGVPRDLHNAATDLMLALLAGPTAPATDDFPGPDLFEEHLEQKQAQLGTACAGRQGSALPLEASAPSG